VVSVIRLRAILDNKTYNATTVSAVTAWVVCDLDCLN